MANTPEKLSPQSAVEEPALLAALRGNTPSRHPVWFMRQAGRSLPEYREARVGTEMLEACLTPELAAEITLQPVRRHDVDAAIFFSDIVIPLKCAGVDVEIVPGTGPVIDHPIRTQADIDSLPSLDMEALAPIREAVSIVVNELGSTPLIGFAGAPFTLACYLVEGGPSKERLHTKALMYSDPKAWHALLSWVADVTSIFLRTQIESGAQAAQLFDSWVGALSPSDYREFVLPHSAQVLTNIGQEVPRIHFGLNSAELLVDMYSAGADVMGIDHHIDLADAIVKLDARCPVQGNIDPGLLFAPREYLFERVRGIVDAGQAAPGHVLNLGHGVPASADPDVLTDLVSFIHSIPVTGKTR